VLGMPGRPAKSRAVSQVVISRFRPEFARPW
jgi:hypothetical protein